jgi:peptide/nickel transport system ATP-binding protein
MTAGTLEVVRLTKHFPAGRSRLFGRKATLHAVDDVTFTLRPGTITALVGESGSGKSTVARIIAKLYDPTAGTAVLRGEEASGVRRYRSQVQMIFQDPFGSLNPVRTVRHHIERPLRIHHVARSRAQLDGRIHELLRAVGLVPPEQMAKKYPHELSGGQRQRVAIARALAVDPAVILADEPISMLDVSIRIGILNLMLDLKRERDIAFLYITHDIASARYVADEVLVMYAGQIVEQGPTDEVLQNAKHPYTQLLLSAVPNPAAEGERQEMEARDGRAVLVDPHEGCRFAPRCPVAVAASHHVTPELIETSPGHLVRCHLYEPSSP